MTNHEVLVFIEGLRDHVAEVTGWSPSACWPTRELLLENLRYNAERGLWGAQWSADYRKVENRMKARGWVAQHESECPKCLVRHARVMLTPAGRRELERMNADGCENHGRSAPGGARRCYQRDKFGFIKRAA